MRTQDSQVACAIKEQTKVLAELLHAFKDESKFWRSRHGLATKDDLKQLKEEIMSAISEFAAKQKSFNERISAAVDGISTDIEELKSKIEQLQNSPGAITAEDQALLDEVQAQAEGIATKIEALDSMNPPTPPSP